jgi:hypothetical protein
MPVTSMLPHCRVANAGSARNLSVIAARSLSFKIDPIVTSFNQSVHFSSSLVQANYFTCSK